MCIEVLPLPDPRNHRFLMPTFLTEDSKSGSDITVTFEGAGSIMVSDRLPDFPASSRSDSTVSVGCKAGRCRTIALEARATSAPRPSAALACRVVRVWIAPSRWNGHRPTSVELANSELAVFQMTPEGICGGRVDRPQVRP